jgi:AbrB family looped-hinge helix DNA binding protein
MVTAKVSKKGWIVIPKKIRERHNIKPGDTVHIFDVVSDIIIAKVLKDPIAVGAGFLKGGTSMAEEMVEEHREEVEKEERDLQKSKSKG